MNAQARQARANLSQYLVQINERRRLLPAALRSQDRVIKQLLRRSMRELERLAAADDPRFLPEYKHRRSILERAVAA